MTKRHASLTGGWSGAYSYPANQNPETVFNVQIEEVGGAFTGAMQEPNVLQLAPGPVVCAQIEGARVGQNVDFVKFYDGSGGMDHAIRYQGAADSALMRVQGRWTIPGVWSGTFFMTRDDDSAEEQVEERVEEAIDARLNNRS